MRVYTFMRSHDGNCIVVNVKCWGTMQGQGADMHDEYMLWNSSSEMFVFPMYWLGSQTAIWRNFSVWTFHPSSPWFFACINICKITTVNCKGKLFSSPQTKCNILRHPLNQIIYKLSSSVVKKIWEIHKGCYSQSLLCSLCSSSHALTHSCKGRATSCPKLSAPPLQTTGNLI